MFLSFIYFIIILFTILIYYLYLFYYHFIYYLNVLLVKRADDFTQCYLALLAGLSWHLPLTGMEGAAF